MRIHTWFLWLALSTALAVPALDIAPAGGAVHAKRIQGATMKIEAALARQRFASGETIAVTVRITNDGAAAIEIPQIHSNRNGQPTYTVTGPAYPQGKTFSFRSAVLGESTAVPADTTAIEPGQSTQEEIPLDQLVRLVEPGTYTLTADLEWNGSKSHSSPVTFTIEPSSIRACELLTGPGQANTTMFRAFCLQAPAAGPTGVQVALFRYHNQLETLTRMSLGNHSTPADGAETIFAPWLGFQPGPGAPSPRPVYQAGSRLAILSFRETGGQAITLPFSPQVVRPALASSDGDQDLFVVDNQGRRLALLRFARQREARQKIELPAQPTPPTSESGTKQPKRLLPREALASKPGAKRPRLLWTMSLPSAITNGRAVLAPDSESRHAVLVADDAAGTRVVLADAGDGSKVVGTSTVNIPGLHVRANSEPALRIDTTGRARAAVILESDPRPDGSLDLSLAEVAWEPRRGSPSLEIRELAKLPAPPRGAAATFSASTKSGRLAWVVLTAGGEVMSSESPERRHLQGTPTLPLDLLLTDRFLALFTLDPYGAPELERL
jgi:hypothetical protein